MRSKISSQIDMGLLAEGISRPGIDPRIWVSYGVLLSEPYIETIEGRQDIIVDVMLMPSGAIETARVGAIYAGNGFGFYAPLHVDDEVLVLAPSGDPDEGLVIAQRFWSPADPPPASLAANPEDVTLVVESGKNLRMSVLGGGNIYLNATGSGDVNIAVADGKVRLGSESASKAVGRVDDDVQITLTPADVLTMALTSPSGPVTATNPVTVTGKITSGATKVVAA